LINTVFLFFEYFKQEDIYKAYTPKIFQKIDLSNYVISPIKLPNIAKVRENVGEIDP